MSLIRPEAAAALHRWREVLFGLGLSACGLWAALAAHGVLGWIGWGLVPLGAALALTGLRRLRFDRGRDGPGVVTVDEGAIAYFGPLSGGVIALSELTRLELDPRGRPAHWRLTAPGQGVLEIPVTAAGAAQLFDVFAALPGLDTPAMLAALERGGDHPAVIWQRAQNRLH